MFNTVKYLLSCITLTNSLQTEHILSLVSNGPRPSSLKFLLSLGQEDKSTPQAQQNIPIMAHVFTRVKLLITFRTFHQNEFSHVRPSRMKVGGNARLALLTSI